MLTPVLKASSISALALSLALLGCSSNHDDVDASIKAKEGEAQFFSKTGVKACGVGAFGAGALCLVLRPSMDGFGCAAIALAGCTIAMSSNYLLDIVRKKYYRSEAQLDYIENFMREDLQSGRILVKNSRKLLEHDREQLKTLERQLASKSINSDALTEKRDMMDANIKYLKSMHEAAVARLEQVKIARNASVSTLKLTQSGIARTHEIDREYQEQKKLMTELEDIITQYTIARTGYMTQHKDVKEI